MDDRSRAMTMVSGAAGLGINFGPAAQMLFTIIGDHGIILGWMRINMYTAPTFLALAINALSIILLVVFFDDRYDEKLKTVKALSSQNSLCVKRADDKKSFKGKGKKTVKIDLIAVNVCIITRAVRMVVTANTESIGSPFSQLMFGFNEREVLHYNSVAQFVVASLVFAVFLVYTCTNFMKYVTDRMSTVGSIILLLIFHFLTMSWPFLSGRLSYCNQSSNETTLANSTETPKPKHIWEWCDQLRPVNVYLYYISYALIFGTAVPCLNNSVQTLLSVVLGKGKQGTMQGLNQAIGCAARILGPLLMSHTFAHFGPRANWAIEIIVLGFCLALWTFTYARMIPAGYAGSKVSP